MAISNVKNYNIAPYYDDFDETKNYHRILFRPGFAVQARELTQLQTALQAQIDKLGQFTFKDGDRVVGGKGTANVTEFHYIKLESTHSGSAISGYLSEFLGTTITGATTGVTAEVIKVEAETTGSPADPATLYLKYTNTGSDNATQTFQAGEVISSDASTVRSATIGGGGGSTIANPIGLGSAISVEEGVYFISGSFVHVPSETLILDKYTNTPSYIVGLRITESIVSSSDSGHTALADNALGTSNESAPGANRYTIDTTLVKEDINLANRTETNYIHLLTIKDGVVFKQADRTEGTEFNKILETRTQEESGDYVVAPFVVDVKEHLNDGAGNGGYLLAGDGGDITKIAVGIDTSVAYIDGRRIEKTESEHVVLDKTRGSGNTVTTGEIVQSIGFGNYIKLDPAECEGIPDVNNLVVLDLKNSGGTDIGTARARGLEYVSASPAHFRLYLFDVTMDSGQAFSSVAKVGQGSTFEANLLSGATGTRFDAGDNLLVYKLPANAISTLKSGGNHTADYNLRARVTGTTISGGSSSFSLPANTTLANNDDVIIHIGALADNNDVTEVSDANISGVGTNTLTVSGLSANNGDAIVAICTVRKTNGQAKTKSKNSGVTNTITYSGSTSVYDLTDVDIIKINSVTDSAGSDVTDKFLLDNGQRDSFYDTGKVILKGGETLPAGDFVVDYDCFRHNPGGDYFSVDSYSSADYAIIPTYRGVQLRDCLDFRPTKARTGATAGSEFSTGTGNVSTYIIPPVDTVELIITHYLARIDKLYLTKAGEYKVVQGIAALKPVEPEGLTEKAIHLYNFYLRPYVFNVGDIHIRKIDNKRYTMRDIGSLEKRVKTLEYYTSLSLLEKAARDAQINDSSGNARFKNGFITDAFYGHNVGDTSHPDYAVSMDKENGIMRPKFTEKSVNLVREVGDSGTAVISSAGGIVTKSYTQVEEINQPYSSYAEFVNPYNVILWDGVVKLSPESDQWKETDVRPDIIIDDSNIYEQFVNMAESEGILGTVWNEWETNWTGREVQGSSSTTSYMNAEEAERLTGVANPDGFARAEVNSTTTAYTNTGTQDRTGIESYVTFDTEVKEIGNYVVETNFIPFMRSREVYFKAELLKPGTDVYAFFNDVNITAYCKQKTFVEFSDTSNFGALETYEGETSHPDSGSGTLQTDSSGKVEGSFIIPRNDVLKFKTGTRTFKITDSSTNNDEQASTKAQENFYAQGILEIYQRTIIATKVPRIAYREVNESKEISETTTETTHELVRYYDPVAESFVIKSKGGAFVTSLDLFFNAKDASIPVCVSIRAVENGTPTQKIVPGAEKVLYPSDVNISSNAATATNVAFDFPVYLAEGQEYAIVLISNSDAYKVYVAETSKFDLTDTSYRITKQPFNGVFFTSANASTWTPEQNKDLKFKLNRASFTTTDETISLVNDTLPKKRLGINPFVFESHPSGSTCKIRVLHKNHGMYGANATHSVNISNVTGAQNGITAATLNGNHVVNDAEVDSYTITVSGQATTLGIRAGGTGVKASENILYDAFQLSTNTLEFPGVGVTFAHTGMGGKSQDGSSDSEQTTYDIKTARNILANKNTALSVPNMIASSRNVTYKNLTDPSFNIVATLSNGGVENLSPVIDLNRTSAITIMNRINDATTNSSAYTSRGTYVAETNGTGTSNVASYISKQVTLNTEATNLDVYINVNRPSNSNIDVYYKATDDTDIDFDALDWTLMTPEYTVPVDNFGRYSEIHYSADTGVNFNKFTVKIVLRSLRSTNVPTVKDFRAIATT